MGGHRFFTKADEVNKMWRDVLAENGEKFLRRPRLSRIFYGGKFFNYPLKPLNALKNLGWYESSWLMASYMRWKVFPHKTEETFEEWVVNRFGRRLFRTFFKTYTEKVWGISTQELKAEWAAQRIKNLSLKSALVGAIWKPKHGKITTLIEEFDYPRRGPGMLWECATKSVEKRGGEVKLDTPLKTIHRDGNRITAVTYADPDGTERRVETENVVSSMPLTELVRRLDPEPPLEVLEAAVLAQVPRLPDRLRDRRRPEPVPRQLDLHPRPERAGRPHPELQELVAGDDPRGSAQTHSSLGLEYFCNENDSLWSLRDDELIRLAARELEKIGICDADRVVDGVVYRVPEKLPGLRRQVRRPCEGHSQLRRRPGEPAHRRPQRPAPLQQPGPLDAHGLQSRAVAAGRRDARFVVGQRRPGVSRGGQKRQAQAGPSRPQRR